MLGQILWKDKPRDWTRDFVPAPDFDVKSYQDKLNEIAGFTTTGEPVLKLFWGGNEGIIKFTEWDSTGLAKKTELSPKFYFNRPNPLMMEFNEQIPLRRWIIAEGAEPSQYRADDDSDTWFQDGHGVKQATLKPRNVYYTALAVIGDHSNCHPDCSKEKLCFGDYTPPNDLYLNFCRDATNWLRNDQKRRDPRLAMTGDEVTKFRQEALSELAEEKSEYNEYMQDFTKDYYNAHKHRFTTDDPSVLKHGRFHFTKGQENVDRNKPAG